MSISDEYKALRDEILMEYQREVNLTAFVSAATAAVIGLGFSQQQPFIFLVPLALLALLLFQLRNALHSILTISVYIRVFIESKKDNSQQWETTIDVLRRKLRSNRRFRSLTDVIFARFTAIIGVVIISLSLVSTFLYVTPETTWFEYRLWYATLIVAAILWGWLCITILRDFSEADSGYYEKVLRDYFEEIYKSTKGK